jgi:hypothetical protein
MACYKPLQGYRSRVANESGKFGIVFNVRDGDSSQMVEVPCGQCIGCRLERSRQWALRCIHEAQMHDKNCFITLTYRLENQPAHGSLELEDFQKFMKRLRHTVNRDYGKKIRYFMCGEYGENLEYSSNGMFGHPHYHACIFGFDFPDKYLHSDRDGILLYRSPTLEELWPLGFSTIGEVTFESAAYTARYVMKKHLGKSAEHAYTFCNASTKEEVQLTKEFTTMSRRPGIGKTWYDQFKNDLKKDFITVRGKKMKPPKYYDGLLEKEDIDAFEAIKEKRKLDAYEKNHIPGIDGMVEERRRQDDAHTIKERRIKSLVRSL